MDSLVLVRYFIHYPQIIHTAFQVEVYSIVLDPGRAFDILWSTFLFPGAGGPLLPFVLIFSWITCIVKGNRNPTSHARNLQRP